MRLLCPQHPPTPCFCLHSHSFSGPVSHQGPTPAPPCSQAVQDMPHPEYFSATCLATAYQDPVQEALVPSLCLGCRDAFRGSEEGKRQSNDLLIPSGPGTDPGLWTLEDQPQFSSPSTHSP